MREERKYACRRCGKLRNKSEGGEIFSVCDECWDKQKSPCDTQGTVKNEELRPCLFCGGKLKKVDGSSCEVLCNTCCMYWGKKDIQESFVWKEIDRLKAQNEKMREALEKVLFCIQHSEGKHGTCSTCCDIIKFALKGE